MIVNLTGRVVRIYSPDRPDGVDELDQGLLQTLNASSPPAKLSPLLLVTAVQDDIPVEQTEYGHVDNLPAAQDNVWYVVPLEIALAVTPRRADVIVTTDPVATADGTVVGYRSLAQPV
ncbi:hypothetical protein [Streptomyces sp. NPDC008150]|uniref:hypothetical protein n=1 Tax=Streptomyces sp. NPDC008150 TaxID=3364816 RepID=UPI0036EF93E7